MSGIYEQDKWSVGQAIVEGAPIIVRARTALPAAPDREIYVHLIVISWDYLGGEEGMPTSETTEQMQTFETAIEASLEEKGVGVQAACITGNSAREWRYYTYDTDEFMAKLNAGLAGHPAYPLRIQLFSDPEWTGLSELGVNA